MARPKKVGLDYYPMDVGFLRDKKVRLLLAEFGASSVLFVLYVLGKAYEEDGYFLRWDDDERCFAANELGQSPAYISEVLQGCLKRSLFDQGVFQMFGILTSAGIQRRYLRGCEKRADIGIAEEYWLLDEEDEEDVPASIRAKLTFFSVSGGRNPVNSPQNPVFSGGNPQRKVKESKVQERKGKETVSGPGLEERSAFYLETYRALCDALPPCLGMTRQRGRAILEYEKTMGRDSFPAVCRRANASRFCRGGNERGWKADFDFLIRPDKATYILEGKYDGVSPAGEHAPPSEEQGERLRREMEWLDEFLQGADGGGS